MPKIQQLKNGQYVLTVSKAVKLKSWKKGDKIDFKVDKQGRIVLEREDTK